MAQQGQSSRTKNRPLLQHIPYICRWHLGNSFVPWDIEKNNRMPPLWCSQQLLHAGRAREVKSLNGEIAGLYAIPLGPWHPDSVCGC